MSKRVRLLTFAGLPGYGCVGNSEFTEATAELLAEMVVYSHHYLQRQGPGSLLGDDDECDASASLRQTLDRNDVSVKSLFLLPAASSAFDLPNIPGWLNAETRIDARFDDDVALQAPDLQVLDGVDFAWLHVDRVVDDKSARMFADLVLQFAELSRRADDVLFVTALNGSQPGGDTAFESLLWEHQIRVPLWGRWSGAESHRHQVVTGSFDLLFTVSQLLEGSTAASGAVPDSLHNLVAIAERPGQTTKRQLKLLCGQTMGVRTDEFLFAKRLGSPDGAGTAYSRSDTALYVKPDDTWNVNDVSAEYLDALEAFEKQVR